MGEYRKKFGDYLALFGRRKWLFAMPALLIFAASVVAAVIWPPTYRSTATVLIEQAEVPREFVQSTVTSFAAERLQVIEQKVTTTETLTQLMERYGIYEDLRKTLPLSAVVEIFREDINLEMIDARVVDPKSGRPVAATIAFTVSYDYGQPGVAQRVANELVSLFLSANLEERREAASGTSDFLAGEAERLAVRIGELEQALATFKEENAGRLPEQLEINLANIERAERELTQNDLRIQGLQERQIFLDAQLAQLQPYLPAAAAAASAGPLEQQLMALRTDYARAQGAYGDRNPDVIRLKREIAALEAEAGGGLGGATAIAELKQTQINLARARERYSAEHPDVRRLAREVESLQARLASASEDGGSAAGPQRTANPAYVSLNAQREAVGTELQTLKQRRSALLQRIAGYQERAQATPGVERAYRALIRDYDNTQARYKDIKDKQIAAELSKSLEVERKAERFSLIEPPLYPEEPIWPNRWAVIGIGLFIALAIGAAAVLIRDVFDDGIYGTRQLAWVVGEPPLVAVPYMATPGERVRGAILTSLGVGVIAGSAALVLAAIHLYLAPLDVLWFRTLQQIGVPGLWS